MAFFAKNKKDTTIQNNSEKRKLKEIFYLSMEYDKTRRSCPWNSDQSCTKKTLPGVVGGKWGLGVGVCDGTGLGISGARRWWKCRGNGV